MSMGAAVFAAERAERLLIEHLRDAGAVHPSAATPLPSQLGMDRSILRRLVKAGTIREAGSKYYLDEAAYTAYTADRSRRRQTVRLILIPLVIAAGLLIWWVNTK